MLQFSLAARHSLWWAHTDSSTCVRQGRHGAGRRHHDADGKEDVPPRPCIQKAQSMKMGEQVLNIGDALGRSQECGKGRAWQWLGEEQQ